MAKGKIDCSLDEIVMEYLKKAKCEKSIKLLGMEHSGESDHSKLLEKFIKFLTKSEREKDNRKADDDLGFEINFAAFQPEKKVNFVSQYPASPIFACILVCYAKIII